jgi:hypothetical protein
MLLDVYISDLEGYDFDGGDFRIGNSPGRWSPFFPQPIGGSRHFWEIKDRVEDGRYKGRQVDWGCWVAVVTKKDILAFIADIYGERGKGFLAHYSDFNNDNMYELLNFIDKLEDGKEYLLAASEL